MGDSVATVADSTAAPKKAAVVKKKTAKKEPGVEVKNISERIVCTSLGTIEPGKTGRADKAEALRLHKFLEIK